MAVTVSITLTDADAARVVAAANGRGFANGKAWVIELTRQAVLAWEQQQDIQQFTDTYQSVSPT